MSGSFTPFFGACDNIKNKLYIYIQKTIIKHQKHQKYIGINYQTSKSSKKHKNQISNQLKDEKQRISYEKKNNFFRAANRDG